MPHQRLVKTIQMIGEGLGSAYDVLYTRAENFFIERFVKKSLDVKVTMSGI